MSHVWVAEQTALDRRVAIKLLTEELIYTEAGLALFEREARATARVDHPHVVRILDSDVTEEGAPFLVLESLSAEALGAAPGARAADLDEARSVMARLATRSRSRTRVGSSTATSRLTISSCNKVACGGIDLKVLDFGIALHKSAARAQESGVVGLLRT